MADPDSLADGVSNLAVSSFAGLTRKKTRAQKGKEAAPETIFGAAVAPAPDKDRSSDQAITRLNTPMDKKKARCIKCTRPLNTEAEKKIWTCSRCPQPEPESSAALHSSRGGDSAGPEAGGEDGLRSAYNVNLDGADERGEAAKGPADMDHCLDLVVPDGLQQMQLQAATESLTHKYGCAIVMQGGGVGGAGGGYGTATGRQVGLASGVWCLVSGLWCLVSDAAPPPP